MDTFTYVTPALNAISNYKNRDGLIASYALAINAEPEIQSLLNAIAVAHDRTIDIDTEHRFRDGPAPVAAPIAFLDFVQGIMNKACGLARKDMQGKRKADFGNGIDFSQELTDQLGFSVDTDKIAGLIDDDFRALNMLHCYIAQGMSYLTDIPALHYHSESVKYEDNTWGKENIADSFDDAMIVLNAKADAYMATQKPLREGDSATIDFNAITKDVPDQKRTLMAAKFKDAAFANDLAKRQADAKEADVHPERDLEQSDVKFSSEVIADKAAQQAAANSRTIVNGSTTEPAF